MISISKFPLFLPVRTPPAAPQEEHSRAADCPSSTRTMDQTGSFNSHWAQISHSSAAFGEKVRTRCGRLPRSPYLHFLHHRHHHLCRRNLSLALCLLPPRHRPLRLLRLVPPHLRTRRSRRTRKRPPERLLTRPRSLLSASTLHSNHGRTSRRSLRSRSKNKLFPSRRQWGNIQQAWQHPPLLRLLPRGQRSLLILLPLLPLPLLLKLSSLRPESTRSTKRG